MMRRREISSFLTSTLQVPQVPAPYLSREGRRGEARSSIQGRAGKSLLFVPSWSRSLFKSQAGLIQSISISLELQAGTSVESGREAGAFHPVTDLPAVTPGLKPILLPLPCPGPLPWVSCHEGRSIERRVQNRLPPCKSKFRWYFWKLNFYLFIIYILFFIVSWKLNF